MVKKMNYNHHNDFIWTAVWAFAILLVMFACSVPFISRDNAITTETEEEQATVLPAIAEESLTLTAGQSTAADSPSAVPQLLTASPTAISTTDVNRPPVKAFPVNLNPGGTSAFDRFQISSGQIRSYMVKAEAGQTLIAGVSSENNNVYLNIQGIEYGQQLLSVDAQQMDWSGVLPDTQGYMITLSTVDSGSTGPGNPGAASTCFFSVEIPADIIFKPGEDSTRIDGYLGVHADYYPDQMTRVRYLAHGSAGQTMTINIDSPDIDSLSLGIYGQTDGQPYKRFEVRGASGSLELPLTQGYYIDVVSTGGVSTAYTLDVAIR